jgi:hypothetical protein
MDLALTASVLADADLRAIAAACPALINFSLVLVGPTEEIRVSDRGIDAVVIGCRALRTVTVRSSGSYLTSASFTAAFLYGTNLEAIHLSGVVLDDTAVQVPSAGASHLRELDCIWGVRSATSNEVPPARFANLIRLQINSVEAGCAETLSVAVRSMPQLQRFSLCAGGDIGLPRILSALAQGCHLLTSIDVIASPRPAAETESSLTAVLANNQKITSICLAYGEGCGEGDAFMCAMGTHCPQLAGLIILHPALLTDLSITALARGCRQLHCLHLSRCTQLTDASLLALATCPLLIYVHLGKCTKLTEPGIQHFVCSCKKLCELTVPATCISEAAVMQLTQESGRRVSILRVNE